MIELALIQHSFKGDKQSTIDFTLESIAKAAQKGANLVALQELHTSEYFCQREDTRFLRYADCFRREVEIFSKCAKQNKVVLVTSLFEKRARGLYHNTAVVFEKDGSIAGTYRKSHIPDDPSFYEKFYFTQGEGAFKPISTSLGKLGVLICWDQWFPEAARLMALGGADILIYPTAIGWDLDDSKKERLNQLNAWLGVQRGHAIANGIFVCAINRCGLEIESEPENIEILSDLGESDSLNLNGESIDLTKSTADSRESSALLSGDSTKSNADSPESTPESNKSDLSKSTKITKQKHNPNAIKSKMRKSQIKFWGHSFIYGPQGEEIAMASESTDAILRASIDLERISQVRNIWPFLRDRRIECYHNLTKRFID